MRSKFKWIFTLLVAFVVQLSFAQEKVVTGTVSDDLGPVVGANVIIKGTTKGTTTDFDGNYTISAKQGDVLVVSFTGMTTQEVTVGASNTYDVVLSAGTVLDELVIVGIVGVKRKEDAVTSAYQKVDSEELNQAANPNAISALQGKVTGLQINTTNNGVNQSNSIVLRGVRSMSGNNEALIVIDNVQSTNEVLSNLAPDVIESFNVLKGGQAAALYGEKGVNGVIVVTTKKGGQGKMSVDISSSVTFEDVAYMAQRQERYGQGWSGTNVSYENGAWGAEMDGVVRPVGLAQADGSYIMAPYSPIKDNIKDFFQTGTVYQNGVTVGGGSLETGYATLMLNNQQTEFVVENDVLNRTTALLKGGKQMGKWTVEGNVQLIKSRTNTTTSALLTELYQAATNIPITKFRNSGNEGHWNSYYRNPYWRMDNERNENRLTNIAGQATLGYKFNENISVNLLMNATSRNTDGMSYVNGYTDVLQVGGGDNSTVSSFSQYNAGQFRMYSDLVTNFNYQLTEDLDFGLNVGFNAQDSRYKITTVGGTNLTIPGLYTIDNVEDIDVDTSNSGSANGHGSYNYSTRERSYAFFGNLDLGYKDYLFLNATARMEANSNFIGGSEDYTYFYPSVGLSFIPTKAFDALSNNKVLNYAKLYASYTRNGNSSILNPYDINPVMNGGLGYPFDGAGNSFQTDYSVTDNGLKPEFMTTTEFGVNLGFFKNRLTLDFAVYQTKTTDLITSIAPSYTSGNSSVLTNVGEMTNKGIEIDLGFTPIKTKDFKWENRVGFTTYKSVVDKVSDQADEVPLYNSGSIGVFAVEGEEFPTIKGTAYERDDQGRVVVDASTGMPIIAEGYKILGKATPDYILNYNTAVTYKGFRLAAVMDYRTGHQFYSGTKQWLSWSGHLYESAINGRSGFIFPNSSYESAPGVYTENTSIVTGGASYTSYINYFQDNYAEVEENFVLDATAFKVRELSLSYSFSDKILDKTKLSKLQIGVNARNPFVVLPEENRGYSDPEFSRTTGNGKGISVVGQYPVTRTFAFTLNASF